MNSDRLDRNIRLFGIEGQDKLFECRVGVVGIGGLGTHVVQQLSLLGVGSLILIDDENVDPTNLNRYVGISYADAVSGIPKVEAAARLAHSIDPEIHVEGIPQNLVSDAAFKAIVASDHVFGCLDSEGARLILNELCAAYDRCYYDLATEIIAEESLLYGGRVCINGQGCIACRGVLDLKEAQADLADSNARRARAGLYGIENQALGRSGPSVVSINGVIASLAVTEFMVTVTGLRAPNGLTTYRGEIGKVLVCTDPPKPNCYYCKGIRGIGDRADVQRFIRAGCDKPLRQQPK